MEEEDNRANALIQRFNVSDSDSSDSDESSVEVTNNSSHFVREAQHDDEEEEFELGNGGVAKESSYTTAPGNKSFVNQHSSTSMINKTEPGKFFIKLILVC